jgi:hypothetical protein
VGRVAPVRRRPSGGEDERAAAVALTHQFVEVLGLGQCVLPHGEVVQDEQVGAQVAPEPLLPAAIGAAAGQVGEQGARLGKEHPPSLPAGFQAQRLRDEGLADACGAAEQHRCTLLDEAAGGQVPEARPVESPG